MRFVTVIFALVMTGISAARAQVVPTDPTAFVPRYTIAFGYAALRANAPPAGCDCFGLNGGFVSGSVRVRDWLSVAGEFTGSHANDISLLGQDLTLMTVAAGPRVSFPNHRVVPFGQVLIGFAHGSDSYFPTSTSFSTSASSFAFTTGGGIDIHLNHRFAVRAIEAQYLRTSLPNGTNNEENHLVLGAGIVFKFRGRYEQPTVHVPPPRPMRARISFTCNTDLRDVQQGQMLKIVGNAGMDAGTAVQYSWMSAGGKILGDGSQVTLDTTNVPEGHYSVVGHATVASDQSVSADCRVDFNVIAPPSAPREQPAAILPPGQAAQPSDDESDVAFHQNVKDIYFDYNRSAIRQDMQQAIAQDAAYFNAHPRLHILVRGYADERGGTKYNLVLGENRANAARDALIAAGVDADRLEVVTFGKDAQFCTADDEGCWKQNRRAAFLLHP